MKKFVQKLTILTILILLFSNITIKAQKRLICWQMDQATGTPAYLIDHWAYIETLPFDGVVIFPANYRYQAIMTPGQTVTYQEIITDWRLSELSAKFNRVKHNYLMAWCHKAEFYDEAVWPTIVQNFANMAKAAKDVGIAGVIFENAQYSGPVWDYPDAVDSSAKYTIEQYRDQVRLRGKQVMAAMIAQFPDIEVIIPHGPYWSEPKFNQQFLPNPVYGNGELAGSFFAGFMEAIIDAKANGHSPKAIDGGELYNTRTIQEFDDIYQFRKNYMPSADNNSAQIPVSLRPLWPANVSISFGANNIGNEALMDPDIMRTTMEYATRRADDIVWFNSEQQDWYTSGGVSQAWIDAVKNGFNAGKSNDGPTGYTFCAQETQSFKLPGTCNVAFGANGKFKYLYGQTGTIAFNNNTFGGDPIFGFEKRGYYIAVLPTSFPIKLKAGSENDLTYTQPATDTWSIASTGTNPYIATVGFSEMYDPSLVKYLSFEYKSTTGISNMDVYYYNPTNGLPVLPDPDYMVSTGAVTAVTQWTEYVIDLSTSSNWNDAGSFQIGFGNEVGKDFTIRNIKLSNIKNIFRTVFFNSQSEIIVDSINTTYEAIIPPPKVPMRLGYSLTGWFKEPECINEWNFATDKVTVKTTLYAKWAVVNAYTITFNSQGGNTVANLTANANASILEPIPPTRTDFRFQGWYKEAACINKWNFATEKITSDTTFFAKWATSTFVDTGKHCLNWPQSNFAGEPSNLINNWDYIETLPFDGVVIFPPHFQYQSLMAKDAKVTYKELFTDSRLGELSQLFDKVRHNYLIAWCNKPGDFFDDKAYSLVAENFAVLAKAAKDAGIAGIIFDDEQYLGPVWDYPVAVDSSAKYTIDQYRVQVRLQGKKVMEAMLAEFPDIEVMFSHGPYWSEPKFNQLFLPNPVYADGELLGSFFLGFVEAAIDAKAAGHSPKVIDGGEFYKPRSIKDFEDLYQFRKNIMPSASNNSPTIPESLRPLWAENVSVASAVSNLANEATMDPTIMLKTMERATRRSDHLVWFYSEGQDWYTPGAISQDWINAVKDGFAAGLLPRVLATSVSVTGADNATTIATKGGTLQMSATFTPENTTDKILFWSVTNGTGKAKIDQKGLLTATGDGTITVKATARDGSNVIGQLIVTISNQVITSVPEAGAGDAINLSLHPNPLGNTALTIDFGRKVSGIVSFFDVNGKLVLTKNIENAENTQIESGILPKGVLIVKAFIAGNMKVSKLVVK